MIPDLSFEHHPIGSLFPHVNRRTMAEYELHPEQIEFFHGYGYLSGVRILSDEQVEALRQELPRLLDASPEERGLFYEYNSNESTDPNHVLFHALGAWRIAPGLPGKPERGAIMGKRKPRRPCGQGAARRDGDPQ